MAWSRNLSCIKVISIIWMIRSGVGISGPFCSYATPCMWMISGLRFARHWHRVVLHVQLSIHSGMMLSRSWWLPCWLSALIIVRCLVYTFDFSRLESWWAVALCLAILRPLRNLLLHREYKCGQVSLSFIWHINVQLGFGCVCGQKRFFPWLPMYWANRKWGVV